METVPCPFCSSSNTIVTESFGNDSFNYCTSCGGEFSASMRPGASSYYEEEADYGAGGEGYRGEKWEFKRFLADAKRFGVSGNVVDIGCGSGEFMKMAAEAGWNAFGVDFNTLAIKGAQEAGITQARVGSVFELERIFPGTRYNAVTLFHVLEHLPEPVRAFRFFRTLLNPRGVVAVAVPNSRRSFLKINLRRRREGWDYPPNHLTRWNAQGLSNFLSKSGFEVLEVVEERVKTAADNLDFLHGFFHFLTSTGVVAGAKQRRAHEPKHAQAKTSLFLKALGIVVFIKNVLVRACSWIFLPFVYLYSKFVYIKGVNLYAIARRKT